MAVSVLAGTLEGVRGVPIEVEVDLLRRLPSISMVGLAASAVKESAERVRSAISSAGLEFPRKRVVVNLAPADVRKDGTGFDLPVAIAILAADGQIPTEGLDKWLIAGELSLSGTLRPIRGAISLALLARDLDRGLLLPRACAAQAAAVPGVQVACAESLAEVVAYFAEGQPLGTLPRPSRCTATPQVDLAEVRGQPVAREALELAAAGGHHVLLMGPPGCGKSMLAKRLPTLLPPLGFDEAIEVSQIYSATGHLDRHDDLLRQRPFRAPHHSVTVAGLIGNSSLRPGEVSLAHHGVLFLDEATEFRRTAIEVLREPLEDGQVRISRAAGSVCYPASLTMVMASNPCPCGRRGSPLPCSCSNSEVVRYRNKLSGPILDRIDLYVELQPVPPTELLMAAVGESSEAVRQRVSTARKRQADRGQKVVNARLSDRAVHHMAQPTTEALRHLRDAMVALHLSGRAANRVIKVARTIADIAGNDVVDETHIARALIYRPRLDIV